MQKFDTRVQHLKYKVLREMARNAFNGTLLENFSEIPKIIMPNKEPTMRCCVYKERAIITERMKIAMGGDKTNPNVIEVIGIACDECPVGGYQVSDSCRGCISKRCSDVCPVGAITFDAEHRAHINKEKCINCGKCANACPFSAIRNNIRPCQAACKVNAISINEDQSAKIDDEKCIACGACTYRCPFGAIVDKSYILDVVEMIKEAKRNGTKLYAMVAPAIASQFGYAKLGQVVSGIKELGFTDVKEVALGADMVALKEAAELAEKGKLTSSCCPAFVSYIHKFHPAAVEYISHNYSPMVELGKYIKDLDPAAKTVFIGPCTAKKAEMQKENVRPYVDSVITFEELQALLDSREIDITKLAEDELNDASFYGRIFAHSGGLTGAAARALEEQGIDFEVKPATCSGVDECKLALLKLSKGVLKENFIEGMICEGGCINGAGCLTHMGPKAASKVDIHAKQSTVETIKAAVADAKI
ncbi:MAG: 4Fe-4S dicluster domain-containing protein [Oscillospiraceae bacterium]|nr:4Fe-4S dicluster domain-containing protein [Oscillospiraceae bacterium]